MSRKAMSAKDYSEKLAKVERDEERALQRLLRATNRVLSLRQRAKYIRRKLSELSE